MAGFLLVVRYSGDAERKRVEYLVESFGGRLRFSRPGGLVLLVEGGEDELGVFLEELYSRVSRDRVDVYRVEPFDVGVEPRRVRLALRSGMSVEEALGAVAAIMAGLRGALVSEAGGVRTYVLSLRGGRVTARVVAAPSDGGSVVRVELEGYGRVFDRAREALARRLSLVGEVWEE